MPSSSSIPLPGVFHGPPAAACAQRRFAVVSGAYQRRSNSLRRCKHVQMRRQTRINPQAVRPHTQKIHGPKWTLSTCGRRGLRHLQYPEQGGNRRPAQDKAIAPATPAKRQSPPDIPKRPDTSTERGKDIAGFCRNNTVLPKIVVEKNPAMRKLTPLFAFLGLFVLSAQSFAADPLALQFLTPPRQARPWVFWMWLRTDTKPAYITRDLEEMKAKGITGFILYDCGPGPLMHTNQKLVPVNKGYRLVTTRDYAGARTTRLPPSEHVPVWSPAWRAQMRFVAKESARLGLDFCLSIGLAGVSSSWVTPRYGQQELVSSTQQVSGPGVFDAVLPVPTGKRTPVNADKTPVYYRDVALQAVPVKDNVQSEDVVDLSAKMDASNHLRWAVPVGQWTIVRLTQVPTGAANVFGLYVDHLSAEACAENWDNTVGVLLKEMTPQERLGLHSVEDDSWEAGRATWTESFPAEFQRRRGYSLFPYLSVPAGKTIGGSAMSERFMRDYRLTLSDMIADNYYSELRKKANASGLLFLSEAAGPHLDEADILKNSSKPDVPMGEFWMPSAHRPTPDARFLLRDAATACHVYGLPGPLCEAFTSAGPQWEESPFSMKSTGDQAFCDGLSRVCIHNYSHSPSLTAKPGYVYFAGTHFERSITWWNETPALLRYLSRCSFLLQQGKFAADAVFYIGDGVGWSGIRKKVLPTLGEGYDYDNCNSDVILTRMSVKSGQITLPDGMHYRLLVLPDDQPMSLDVLRKLALLARAGATLVGPPPTGRAGLAARPGEDAAFTRLVSQLWGSTDGRTVTEHRIGLGRVLWGQTARQALQSTAGAGPDFQCTGTSPAGEIDWIHRTSGTTEIYFVASRWEPQEHVRCSFRVTGKRPELWNPVTGAIRDAASFQQKDGATTLPLDFDPCGSTFVIFRKPVSGAARGMAATNSLLLTPITELTGPWTASFDPNWGGPARVTFETLTDWTQRPEDGIKYYSGHAVYRKHFVLPSQAQGKKLILDLGDVKEVASVRLNGQDLGVVWTHPSRVEITNAVKAGDNALEVTVVNLWPNRLIGDEKLPLGKHYTETNMHKFGANSPLLPSGLLGPVQVLSSAQ